VNQPLTGGKGAVLPQNPRVAPKAMDVTPCHHNHIPERISLSKRETDFWYLEDTFLLIIP